MSPDRENTSTGTTNNGIDPITIEVNKTLSRINNKKRQGNYITSELLKCGGLALSSRNLSISGFSINMDTEFLKPGK